MSVQLKRCPVCGAAYITDELYSCTSPGCQATETWMPPALKPVCDVSKLCEHIEVAYNCQHDSFYCVVCKQGMGMEYYAEHIAEVRR